MEAVSRRRSCFRWEDFAHENPEAEYYNNFVPFFRKALFMHLRKISDLLQTGKLWS